MKFLAVLAVAAVAVHAAEPVTKDAITSSSNSIIPQVATGGSFQDGFYTTFQLVNLSAEPISVSLSFFDSQGNAMVQPVSVDSGPPLLLLKADLTMPAKSMRFVNLVPDGAVRVGWAKADSSVPGQLAVYTTFNQVTPGRPLFQTGIPFENTGQRTFMAPSLDAGPFTSSMALVSLKEQNVTLVARTPAGVELCRKVLAFTANQHRAFLTKDQLPCSTNIDSVIEVIGEATGVTGLSLSAHDSGAFVTQTVLGPVN